MQAIIKHSHAGGLEIAREKELYDWTIEAFNCSTIVWQKGAGKLVRNHIQKRLLHDGWSNEFNISNSYDLKIMGQKNGVIMQLQTGNISRVPYDFLKFQYLFTERRVEMAIYCLPTAKGAYACGPSSNIAQIERISSELKLFHRIITIPIFLVGFE
ncbi:BglII/BstYI family type II restriction endonuclease [Leptospira sp. SA-E8]|uniref:BglII/BstYI family type II restriction endonuclease n=1 Tax=Leptospira sp. SA-E8 TaxID=3422259 RepID=UPI003EBCD076